MFPSNRVRLRGAADLAVAVIASGCLASSHGNLVFRINGTGRADIEIDACLGAQGSVIAEDEST
jgi:hypothetical protein